MDASLTNQNIGIAAPDTVGVPLKWRVGQAIVIAFIVATALYFNFIAAPYALKAEKAGSVTPFDQLGFFLLVALTWLTTPVVGVIATSTLREALRRRWMLGMFAFTLIVLALSSAFTRFQPGEEIKMLRDFGMGFIITMTVGMTIVLGAGLVPPEIERRTLYTILAKPIRRFEYILGKFLGLALTLGLNLLVISSVYLTAYSIFHIRQIGFASAVQGDGQAARPSLLFDLANLGNALLLHFGQLVLLATLALLLSLIVSQITAILFCVTTYFGGQMSSYWQTLGSGARTGDADTPGLSKPVQGMMTVFYYVLPRLDRFDVREKLVTDMVVSVAYVWRALNFATVYIAVLLVITILVFSEQEF